MLWGRQPGKAEKGNRNPGDLVYGLGALCAVIFFLAAEPMLRALGAPSLEEAKIYLQTCSVRAWCLYLAITL